MKWIVLILFVAVAISVTAQPTWTSIASGDWNNPSIWATSGGASGSPLAQISTNMRVVVAGHTITNYNTNLQIINNGILEIVNGGQLRLYNGYFYQMGTNTLFRINQGSFEANGSNNAGLYFRIDQGSIEWSDAIVRSGGQMFASNFRATLNNTCISTGSWMQWLGVGSVSNYSTMNNVSLFAGTHTQNSNQLIISNS